MAGTTKEDLLELAYEHAVSVVCILGQQLMPSWLLLPDKEPKATILGTPWKDQFEREVCKIYMVGQFVKMGVKAYSFCSEAWIANQNVKDGETIDQAVDRGGGPVVNRPDKKECVIAFARDESGSLFRSWDIVRDERTGKAKKLLVKDEPLEGFEGWMTRLPLVGQVEQVAAELGIDLDTRD